MYYENHTQGTQEKKCKNKKKEKSKKVQLTTKHAQAVIFITLNYVCIRGGE